MPFVAPAAYREIYGIELPPLSHIFAFNKTRRHTDFKPVCLLVKPMVDENSINGLLLC